LPLKIVFEQSSLQVNENEMFALQSDGLRLKSFWLFFMIVGGISSVTEIIWVYCQAKVCSPAQDAVFTGMKDERGI
jgi:hypothetical protein